jgi:hypothetical protein
VPPWPNSPEAPHSSYSRSASAPFSDIWALAHVPSKSISRSTSLERLRAPHQCAGPLHCSIARPPPVSCSISLLHRHSSTCAPPASSNTAASTGFRAATLAVIAKHAQVAKKKSRIITTTALNARTRSNGAPRGGVPWDAAASVQSCERNGRLMNFSSV